MSTDERIRDFVETDAELMTTICPACEMNLTHGMYEADLNIRVLDIAEIMAVSSGLVDPEILESDYFVED